MRCPRMEPHSVQPVLMSVSSHLVHREGTSELALQRRPAVRDGVALQHAGDILELVAGLADSDRVAKQQTRPGRAPTPQRKCSASRLEVPGDRCRARSPNFINRLRGRERVVEVPDRQKQRKPPRKHHHEVLPARGPISFHT